MISMPCCVPLLEILFYSIPIGIFRLSAIYRSFEAYGFTQNLFSAIAQGRKPWKFVPVEISRVFQKDRTRNIVKVKKPKIELK